MCLDEGRQRADSVRWDDDRGPFPRNDCSGRVWEFTVYVARGCLFRPSSDADRKIELGHALRHPAALASRSYDDDDLLFVLSKSSYEANN